MFHKQRFLLSAGVIGLSAGMAQAADVILTDLIVKGSACVGLDCSSSESFGFDTLRLKENNLRIHFNDTSVSAAFPTVDWRILANDTTNGGENYLSFQDVDAGRRPFTVEAGAQAHTLYVEGDGDVGIKTRDPVVDLHIVEGNTPTMRLEQDGSDGFQAQVYDVAANEANFFIRDVTNGSALFFRAKPGAPEDSIFIAADGDIGMGTDAPAAPMHIRTNADISGAAPHMVIENFNATTAQRTMLTMRNNGGSQLIFEDTADSTDWRMAVRNADNDFAIVAAGTGTIGTAVRISDTTGDMTVTGQIFSSGGTCGSGCDLVFADSYELPTIEEHNTEMWRNGFLPNVGPTPENTMINVSDKLGRMLNELEHAHIFIGQLNNRIKVLEAQLEEERDI